MQQISLENLVHVKSPQWVHLLKQDEKSHAIILRNGMDHLKSADLMEIVEAVISEHMTDLMYH